jgi:hypothetical protein
MRILTGFFILFGLSAISLSCSENNTPESDYTGQSLTYDLNAGSEGGVPGTVEFRERVDKSIDIIIKLDKMSGDAMLPAHLHFGDLSIADNPQAAMLNNYDVAKGESITNIRQLADDTPFTFDRVTEFDGSIKVHLAHSGDDYNVIVAAGNIGSNESLGFNLQSIGICSPDLVNK